MPDALTGSLTSSRPSRPASFRAASHAAGINTGNVHRWLRRGQELVGRIEASLEEGAEPYEPPAHDLPLIEFIHDLEVAKASGTVELLRGIRVHVEKNWRAAAWFLERTRPDEFGSGRRTDPPDSPPVEAPHVSEDDGTDRGGLGARQSDRPATRLDGAREGNCTLNQPTNVGIL